MVLKHAFGAQEEHKVNNQLMNMSEYLAALETDISLRSWCTADQ